MVNESKKRMRFANPDPLNFETLILHDVIPGGVTIGEVDAAIQEWWRTASCAARSKVPSLPVDPSS